MTKDEFGSLPLLLTRREFLHATGIDRRELSRLVATGDVKAWAAPDGKLHKARYRKIDAARLAGLPM